MKKDRFNIIQAMSIAKRICKMYESQGLGYIIHVHDGKRQETLAGSLATIPKWLQSPPEKGIKIEFFTKEFKVIYAKLIPSEKIDTVDFLSEVFFDLSIQGISNILEKGLFYRDAWNGEK